MKTKGYCQQMSVLGISKKGVRLTLHPSGAAPPHPLPIMGESATSTLWQVLGSKEALYRSLS
jgi:hypothetical protein